MNSIDAHDDDPPVGQVLSRREALLLGLGLLGLFFREEIEAAIRVWMNSTAYNHCVLIIPIAAYLAYLKVVGPWDQHIETNGLLYSIVTGICVGVGTVLFFLLFQSGGPLSAVPGVLAFGSAIMVIAGLLIFHEPLSRDRMLGILLSIAAIWLLKRP